MFIGLQGSMAQTTGEAQCYCYKVQNNSEKTIEAETPFFLETQ